MTPIKGKVAVITGAGRGIGRAIAERFSEDGARLALVDLDEPNLKTTLGNIQKRGAEGITVTANISKPQEVLRMVDETVRRFGTIDILVNNAGIVRDQTLLKMTEENFDAVIAVNLKGVFLCGQACARVMVEKKYGKIVNISSSAWRGNFGQSNYSAAKAGVVGMTKTWALELAKHNINVNAVAPGFISTDMTATIPPEIREKMIAKIPLARAGEPSDVAQLVHFLASDDSSYIQGEVIGINGGFQM
ncbi:MAG TPA: 3-oxoacyl-ACP reductase FabG [Bdellovibrionota bacterium]|nr:3-oxoacyl-ACP reductase FabG [Bdellovibrionota bacterium]